jgi:DNA-directed RNA polymerase specialized sigma24 family protein
VPGELLVDINDVEVADLHSDLEHSVSVKEEYQHFLAKALEILSTFEHSVFLMMLRGYSSVEIAAIRGVDIKSVRNAVQRIRTKLK